ncbi:unnamed protein product, partial [Cyprideis torosa]
MKKLRDRQAKGVILSRLRHLGLGDAGDSRSLGDGLHELRIHLGPGYRVYYLVDNQTIIVLLCGGDKSSQRRDIRSPPIGYKHRKFAMNESFERFDAADYLDDEDDIRAYLDACQQSGDPSLVTAALGDIARARNMSALAREVGMHRAGLYKALSRDGNPSFAAVSKVAQALGLRV